MNDDQITARFPARELAEPEAPAGLPPVRTDLTGAEAAAVLSASSCYGTSLPGIEAECGSGEAHGPH